jgi:hypothetical protein
VSAAQYRIISPAGGETENGSADVAVTDGTLTVAPSAGSTLRVPSGQIRSVTEPQPFTVLVGLADGTSIELTRLGTMRTQLLAELRDARAQDAATATAAVGDAEVFSGTAGADSAQLRVYDDALVVVTATAAERISFSFVDAVGAADYTVTIDVAGRAPVSLSRLGRRTSELSELLATRLAQARGRTSAFLGSLLPGLEPMALRAAAGLLRDGVAVPVSALDAIHPELSSAMLGIATLPDRRDAVAGLASQTGLAIGFKQVTSVWRPAVGVTPWHDHAVLARGDDPPKPPRGTSVTPHIGEHESPGGQFGPGLGGMLAAGAMSAMGPGGFAGPGPGYGPSGGMAYGGYGFADWFGGWGDYWAFRALGAGSGGGSGGGFGGPADGGFRPMAPRPDVTRGRLTPATEDMSALTATGDDPTVLAFALGGRAGLVVYEVLNKGEPMTYAYRPDDDNALAAVNRALDDAGFRPAALHAEGLTAAPRPDARTSPLARWLAGQIPHDDHWSAALAALLAGE